MRSKTNNAMWTVFDLWIGILIHFVFFEIIGIYFVTNRTSYTWGLLYGCMTAALLAWIMYRSLDAALEMGESEAVKCCQRDSMIRMLIMLAAAIVGMKVYFFNFPAVIIGILGLKASAFIQPVLHPHIIEKLLKKGG